MSIPKKLREIKVSVIGAGNMGGALISGIVRSRGLSSDQITAVDVDDSILEEHRTTLGVQVSRDARKAIVGQDVIVLGLKPQNWKPVVEGFKDLLTSSHLVVSIMAGVRLLSIEEVLGNKVPVVRTMPNLLVQVGSCGTAICLGKFAGSEHLKTTYTMFELVGEPVVVDETQMDAVTGLSGSGPAYVYAIIDALSDGGVKVGLPKTVALKLAVQTVLGAARMVLESGEHPAMLKDRVTSPGGTTIAGLAVMEAGGFRAMLMEAVEAATLRSEELGKT